MGNRNILAISELLEALTADLSTEDILSAMVLGDISTQIASERIKRNMNQKEFAEFMGTTQAVVSKWESSDRNFTVKKLAEIACRLNLGLSVQLSKMEQPKETGKNNIIQFPSNGWISETSSDSSWTEELEEM